MELPELVVGQLVVQLASQRLCADRPNDLEDLWRPEPPPPPPAAATPRKHVRVRCTSELTP